MQQPLGNLDGIAQSCGVMTCSEICMQGNRIRLICGVERALIRGGGNSGFRKLVDQVRDMV
jgi:hypothetical protein